MQKILDLILNLSLFRGKRTQIVQVIFWAYAVYKGLVLSGLVPNVLQQDLEGALVAIFAAQGLKFAKEHKPVA